MENSNKDKKWNGLPLFDNKALPGQSILVFTVASLVRIVTKINSMATGDVEMTRMWSPFDVSGVMKAYFNKKEISTNLDDFSVEHRTLMYAHTNHIRACIMRLYTKLVEQVTLQVPVQIEYIPQIIAMFTVDVLRIEIGLGYDTLIEYTVTNHAGMRRQYVLSFVAGEWEIVDDDSMSLSQLLGEESFMPSGFCPN